MLGLLFTLWGLGLSTVALIALTAILVLNGRFRLAEISGAALAILLVSGYLYRSGEAACEQRTAAEVAAARAELQQISDKALADASARAADDDARLADLQQKVADYERALGTSGACTATGTDADHFRQLVPAR